MRHNHPNSVDAAAAIGPLNKGLGALSTALDASRVVELNWNLLREDLSLPTAVLYQDKLLHNLHWMRKFIAAYGMLLAPHGKTTMAPILFKMQLDAGAWGITLATAHQVNVAYAHGVRRILMANQLVGKSNMAIIARLLADAEFEFYCLVDSAEQVDQLGAYYSAAGLHINVLIELGVDGGRAGIRNDEQLASLLTALAHHSASVSLCGVEVYEGVLDNETAVRAFVQRANRIAQGLAAQGAFKRTPFLISGAGSYWYDVVAEEFSAANFGLSAEIVLRPGCYLTHDVGSYKKAQARICATNPVALTMHDDLVPALHVWAYVQSLPEPTRAIVGMGRRDAAFDSGLPVPALHFRPGQASPSPCPAKWSLTRIMDQHAYLEFDPADDVRIGDMIAFDICHPCLTFDKWRVLPILDAEYNVIDVAQTYF